MTVGTFDNLFDAIELLFYHHLFHLSEKPTCFIDRTFDLQSLKNSVLFEQQRDQHRFLIGQEN